MLKLKTVSQPSKNISFVFFLFDGENVTKQPLFENLAAGEKDYVGALKKSANVKEKEVRVVIAPDTERKIFFIGLGEAAKFNQAKAGLMTRVAVQAARKEKIQSFAFYAGTMKTPRETRDFYEVVAANAVMANFEFVKYKSQTPEGPIFLKEIELVVGDVGGGNGRNSLRANENNKTVIDEGLYRGMIVGEETNACRTLANTPGGDMTPDLLAVHASKVSAKLGIRVATLDEKKIKSLGMGGVLGVAKGSEIPPRFIVLEYMHGPKSEKPTVLVGKGVTFDTGGLNLKPSDHIYEMHMDMSGGAAVIHALIAAARLKLKKNIVVLVPAVENMPSGSSYRPGDVLRTMSGKTIEVLNTDAEGRVILADALGYAQKYSPALVVDVATLTGAAEVALGHRYSAVFATSKSLEEKFRALGDMTGDAVWPMPLNADYEEDVRGTFGDWANTSKKGSGGGAITAAVFLWQFTKDAKGEQAYPWVHLDIAPRMTAIESEYLAKGAAGAPVRLLVRLLEG
jgi:leucyl aminopeptidase